MIFFSEASLEVTECPGQAAPGSDSDAPGPISAFSDARGTQRLLSQDHDRTVDVGGDGVSILNILVVYVQFDSEQEVRGRQRWVGGTWGRCRLPRGSSGCTRSMSPAIPRVSTSSFPSWSPAHLVESLLFIAVHDNDIPCSK
eukprot:748501-Hanusia_phi.AAC.5